VERHREPERSRITRNNTLEAQVAHPKCVAQFRGMGVRIIRVVAVAVLLWSTTTLAQSADATAQPARFEVASVKLHTSDDGRVMMVAQPGGRFVALNVPLRHIIRTAFQLQDDQIVGGPDWLDTDRFDIEARAANMPGVPSIELLTMLQSLLAERFKLTTHREMREVPVFALERVRRDGELGAGLRPTACPELAIDFSRPKPCVNISNGSAFLTLRGMPFTEFARYLAPYVHRVVIDRTGLEGRYDIDLKFSPEQQGPAPGPAPAQPTGDPDRPSIFTAIQEQLALKLESTMDTVEVLVIDTLSHPTPN
jgi:uncharacterized protein (TIGR03435 family)